jgi:predicted nucleic acid-binding protein
VTALVLDSSIALAWLLEDETTDIALGIRDGVLAGGAAIPALWHLEVGNVLLMAERRSRISRDFRLESLRDLGLLPLDVDTETTSHAWGRTLALAERHRLTLYDACYLELALRRNLPLATLDSELRSAAGANAVPLLG